MVSCRIETYMVGVYAAVSPPPLPQSDAIELPAEHYLLAG